MDQMSNEAVVARFNRSRPPAIATLGGEVIEADAALGRVTMRFKVKPEFCHSGDIVQGGFITGMLDTSMAHAALAKAHFHSAVPTLEVKVSFFAPGRPGIMIARGSVVHWGRSIGFCEAELTDEAGTIIARATATCRIVKLDKPVR